MFERKNNFPKKVITIVGLVIVAMVVAVFFLVDDIGNMLTTRQNLDTSFITPEPEGYIYFSGFTSADRRPQPLVYDIQNDEILILENDESFFYQQVYPFGDSLAKLVAPFVPRRNDELVFTHDDYLQLKIGEQFFELNILMPGGLQWSEENQVFAFHGIRRDFASQNSIEHVFQHANLADIENWSIFLLDITTGEIQEIERGVSPVWGKGGNSLFYLGSQGVVFYDLNSNLKKQVTRLSSVDEFSSPFFPSGSRLFLDKDAKDVYVSLLSSTTEHDALLKYRLTDFDSNDVVSFDIQFLPGGTHTNMMISPEVSHAGFIVYNYQDDKSFTLRLLDVHSGINRQEIIDSLTYPTHGFSVWIHPTWSAIQPSNFLQ